MKKIFLIAFLQLFLSIATVSAQPDYIPGKLVIKFEKGQSQLQSGYGLTEIQIQAQEILGRFGLISMNPYLPQTADLAFQRRLQDTNSLLSVFDVTDDLKRTHIARISREANIFAASGMLSALPGVEFAEPYFMYEVTDIPNDPLINEEGADYFEYHRFFEAWGVSKSSEDVVIAVVDTGVLYTHEDLQDGLWRNPDPGRASSIFPLIAHDTIGWNFFQSGDFDNPVQNNNPIGDYNHHGTFVAGLSAADTDNGIGIAGTGFKARYMAVKVGGTKEFPRNVPFGPDGILYAAINGADIINCSFGSPNYSRHLEDIVNTATDLGSLVVAAAGNENNNKPFYPASFANVLNVGAETHYEEDGLKARFSSYGYTLDVFAAGAALLSTSFNFDDETGEYELVYRRGSGTSYSAPLVSGLAALLKSKYPDWSPQRIAQQIRATARNIETTNSGLIHQMGNGSIDAYRALTDLQPGPVVASSMFLNSENGKLNTGENGYLDLEIYNHGSSANVTLSGQTAQGSIRFLENQQTISLQEGQHQTVRFSIDASFNLHYSVKPVLRLDIQNETGVSNLLLIPFEDFDYDVMSAKDFSISFLSNGNLGFRTARNKNDGVGFRNSDGEDLIFEGGLLTSYFDGTQSRVMDNTRRFSSHKSDFIPLSWFRTDEQNFHGNTTFISSLQSDYPGLKVEFDVFQTAEAEYENTLWLKYTYTNNGSGTLENIYTGLFTNWIIPHHDNNSVRYLPEDSLSVIFSTDEDSPYISIAHLGNVASAFVIDNNSEMTLEAAENRSDSLSFGIYYNSNNSGRDGFRDWEKFLALTAGTEKTELEEKELSTVMSSGPYRLPPGVSFTTGFLLSYAGSIEELTNQVRAARELHFFEISGNSVPVSILDESDFSELPGAVKLLPSYPNPFNPVTTITYQLPRTEMVTLSVYDMLGRQIRILEQQVKPAGTYQVQFNASRLSSGLYHIVFEAGEEIRTTKITLIK